MSYMEVGQLYRIVSLCILWLTCVQNFDDVGKVRGHMHVYVPAGGLYFSHRLAYGLFAHSNTHKLSNLLSLSFVPSGLATITHSRGGS